MTGFPLSSFLGGLGFVVIAVVVFLASAGEGDDGRRTSCWSS